MNGRWRSVKRKYTRAHYGGDSSPESAYGYRRHSRDLHSDSDSSCNSDSNGDSDSSCDESPTTDELPTVSFHRPTGTSVLFDRFQSVIRERDNKDQLAHYLRLILERWHYSNVRMEIARQALSTDLSVRLAALKIAHCCANYFASENLFVDLRPFQELVRLQAGLALGEMRTRFESLFHLEWNSISAAVSQRRENCKRVLREMWNSFSAAIGVGAVFDSSAMGPEECNICLSSIVNGETRCALPCSHEFHNFCIGKWLEINNNCPICRAKVEPE